MARVVNLNACDQKPEIDYPTFWEYKIIFEKGVNANAICQELLGQREFSCKFSHASKNDTYHSFLLRVFVDSEKDRLDLFAALKARAKFVL